MPLTSGQITITDANDSLTPEQLTNLQDMLARIILTDPRGLVVQGVDAHFEIVVGAAEIGFYQDNNKVAYITGSKMYITSAELVAEMKIGNYLLKATADGGLVFM